MRYSRHITSFIDLPKSIGTTVEWIGFINQTILKHDINVVMPVFEEAARNLVEYRHELVRPNIVLLSDTLEKFETAQNKWLLSEHLNSINIPGPKSIKVLDALNSSGLKRALKFPVLLKPTKETGDGKGIVKFEEEDSLRKYLDENTVDPSCIIQEYIAGHDFGCNVICRGGEILAYTIQKGTVFTNRPFSPQVGLKMIHNEEILAIVTKLMKSLEWNGVANIDMRYDTDQNRYVVLEINTRFWYTVLASAIAGVNFPWLYCLAVLKRDIEQSSYDEIEYLNNHGLYQLVLKRPWKLFNLSKIWKRTPIRYQVMDPVMTVYHLSWALRNKLRSLFILKKKVPS